MKNSSQLLKFTEVCMGLATAQMPLYSSKFSKHTFTQPQLAVLYCLKIKLDTTYREAVPGAGGHVPSLQRGAGAEAGGDPT